MEILNFYLFNLNAIVKTGDFLEAIMGRRTDHGAWTHKISPSNVNDIQQYTYICMCIVYQIKKKN